MRDDEITSALPENLEALPQLDGFRLRGLEMTRLETFIDAAFAFAVTMMVIASDRVPDDINALLAAFKHVPAFVASVAVLGIFWRGHWIWSRRYGLEDGVSIFISWALLVDHPDLYLSAEGDFSARCFTCLATGQLGQPLGLRTEPAGPVALLRSTPSASPRSRAEILLLYLRAWQLREPLRLNDQGTVPDSRRR